MHGKAKQFWTATATLLMLCFALVLVPPADAAWARLVMVHGGSLEKPVVVEDGHGIAEAFSPKDLQSKVPEGVPSFELTLFWGPEWSRYVNEGKPLDQLRPEDAATDIPVPTKGRFYPACGDSAAVIALQGLTSSPRIWKVSAVGLDAFARSGVPVSLDCPPR